MKINKCVFGDEHPDVATCIHNLAYVSFLQERYDQAEYLFQESLEIRRSSLNQNHPHLASSFYHMAKLFSCLDRDNEARNLYLDAIKIYEEVFGEEHSITKKAKHEFRRFLNKAN